VIRPLFNDWSRASNAGDATAMGSAYGAIKSLELAIEPAEGDQPLTEFLLYIEADRVRLRY
jgi:hypothetical protein